MMAAAREQTADKSAEELRSEVEQARNELAGTVAELSERLDPRPKVEHAKRQAAEAGRTGVRYGVPAVAALGLVAALFFWLRER